VNLPEIYRKTTAELNKGIVTPRILLDRLRVPDESCRKSSEYQDSRYVPFFYHLGKFISPTSLFQLGVGLGFPICSLLQSCKSVEKIFLFQPSSKEFFSPRLTISNIKDHFKGDLGYSYGNFTDVEFAENFDKGNWDFAFVNVIATLDSYRNYLDLVWQRMPVGGIIAVDYLSSYQESQDAFSTFCKVVNREPVIFNTRNGTGLIQK
jgi:hypothetical protein